MQIRRTAAALTSAAALSITGVAMATPASAAPVFTGGLVNVTIVDAVDVNNNTVQIPLAIAANVCDVNLAVLVAEIVDTGSADCDATSSAVANAPRPRR